MVKCVCFQQFKDQGIFHKNWTGYNGSIHRTDKCVAQGHFSNNVILVTLAIFLKEQLLTLIFDIMSREHF